MVHHVQEVLQPKPDQLTLNCVYTLHMSFMRLSAASTIAHESMCRISCQDMAMSQNKAEHWKGFVAPTEGSGAQGQGQRQGQGQGHVRDRGNVGHVRDRGNVGHVRGAY